MVGARKDYGRQAILPHNSVYVLLGAGLLWFGWFGFNGGSGLSTGNARVLAFTNTLLTPACALATWFVLDLIRSRQVTAIGAATAIIVGCVGITPAAGFISPIWAMVLGVVAALPAYGVIVWRTRTRVDETLDVLAAHGVAGFTGILFIGVFAQASWNGVADGALYGDLAQLGEQALAAIAAPAYAFVRDVRAAEADRPGDAAARLRRRGGDRHGHHQPRRGGLPHRRGRDPGRPGRRSRPSPCRGGSARRCSSSSLPAVLAPRWASTASTRRCRLPHGSSRSLSKIAVTWRSTARSDRYTVLAIARLLRPSAISRSTSRSRSVSASRRERRPTTCATTAGSSTEPPAATSRTAEMKRADVRLDQVPDSARAGVEQPSALRSRPRRA